MDNRHPNPHGDRNNDPSHRRARSYSQPATSPAPGPSSGSSTSHRPPDSFDFLNSHTQTYPHPQPGPSTSAITTSFAPFATSDFDDDALLRSILSMTDDQHHQGPHTQSHPFPHLPQHLSNLEHMPAPQTMHQFPTQPQLAANPLLSQTFAAWLQYMQLQLHLQQQQQQQQAANAAQQPRLPPPPPPPPPHRPTHPQQQHAQQTHSPFPQSAFAPPPPPLSGAPAVYVRSSPQQQTGPTNTPSPDAGGTDTDMDNTPGAEEKRRRNTAASARFRVKKKQWTLNLERSITDLSGRVEELEREAAELRRENGWLKEIVMLKSKRFGAPAPESIINELNAGPSSSSAAASSAPPPDDEEGDSDDDKKEKDDDDDDAHGGSGKGKEVQR